MEMLNFSTEVKELPIRVLLSMEPLFKEVELHAKDKNHFLHKSSLAILEYAKQFPELRTGIEDFSQMGKYEEALDLMLKPLFPDLLQSNEIKAMSVPFVYKAFYLTKRFSKIIENAGANHVVKMTGNNVEKAYIYASSYILAKYYKQPILNLSRPISFDIPNQKTGKLHHYRLVFNVDNAEITKTDKAPNLTQSDIDELLANGENVDLWKQKFPPNSYTLKGFGIMNLFDTTSDTLISKTRALFLRKDDQVFSEFQQNIRNLFNSKDLLIGVSNYDTSQKKSLSSFLNKTSQSLFMKEGEAMDYRTFFCEGINACVLSQTKNLAISDVDAYAKKIKHNAFSKRLKKQGIQSIILIPIEIKGEHIQLLEIASTRKNEVNILISGKLDEIIPFIKIAAERYFDESENVTESTIQENYTSIHPAVKWRFVEAANNFNAQKLAGVEDLVLENIVFDGAYPLYGQSDIVGSSSVRNKAIQADLELQLSLVIDTLKKVMILQDLPIYRKLVYRIQSCLESVKRGLNAGDEAGILDFLKMEIYPVFNHVITLSPEIKKVVDKYLAQIDPELKVIYKQRKAYEKSVNLLNDKLASFLDRAQIEAQQMFPHYFERYKTDGVEYNMYIGASLVNNRTFNPIYLQNLRLWQLEMMCKIENVAYQLVNEMPYPLRVASLILVHSTPLSIKFHMDQKQFDVDGAYNARYEIVKKRIDKSYIKGTEERLTQAGKIAIVYSQDADVPEYLNYIEFLQSENRLGQVEMLELQDLQGLSGLKAIRVEVIYNQLRKGLKAANGKPVKATEEMVRELGIVVSKN